MDKNKVTGQVEIKMYNIPSDSACFFCFQEIKTLRLVNLQGAFPLMDADCSCHFDCYIAKIVENVLKDR